MYHMMIYLIRKFDKTIVYFLLFLMEYEIKHYFTNFSIKLLIFTLPDCLAIS